MNLTTADLEDLFYTTIGVGNLTIIKLYLFFTLKRSLLHNHTWW